MNDKLIRQLNHEIADALAERSLTAVSSRRSLLALLRTPAWEEGLQSLFPIRARLNCTRVLEVCAPILSQLSPSAPEDGWGHFCYRYVCSLMYPHGGFAPDAAPYADGAVFGLTVLQVLLRRERAVLPFDPLLDFQFLREAEYAPCEKGQEYRRFLRAWREEFIYELMRLGMEIGRAHV